MMTTITKTIAELNDQFRKGKPNKDWIITPGARSEAVALLEAVAKFDTFTQDNDPYREHDFGSIEIEGDKYFWKIDYYDLDRAFGSADPSDPAVTRRVMTIMECNEY